MSSHHPVPVQPFTRLSRLPEYGVERHEPDPRGWAVVNRTGKKVGEVKDLIVDTHRMTARYLDVELDTKLFDLKGDDPRILVPVGRAHVNGKHLVIDDITETWIADFRAERDAYQREFWDRWWSRGDELKRAINEIRPGETVRIPVENDEIVVERRPRIDETQFEHTVVSRSADEPLPRS